MALYVIMYAKQRATVSCCIPRTGELAGVAKLCHALREHNPVHVQDRELAVGQSYSLYNFD